MSKIFTTKPCSAQLTGLVTSIWSYRGSAAHAYEHVLPGVTSQLLINLHESELRHWVQPGSKLRSIGPIGIQGVITSPVLIDTLQKRHICGVAFTSFGVSAFCDTVASRFTDSIVDASKIWGESAIDLRQALLDCGDPKAQCRMLEAFLLERLTVQNSEIELLKRVLYALSAGDKISDIQKRTGMSQRALHTLFDKRIGVRPKTFARIERFVNVLGSLPSKEALTDLAFSNGYADQAHLTREFRAFAGRAPTQHAPVANESNHAILK